MELAAIIGSLTPLKQWFDFLRTKHEKGRERYQEALEAVYTALNETRIYLGSLDSKSLLNTANLSRNKEKEANLSRLWTQASTKMRNVDHQWAIICFEKGGYWANPEAWSDDELKEAGIKIEDVIKEAQELL